jgi:hypothetical protein
VGLMPMVRWIAPGQNEQREFLAVQQSCCSFLFGFFKETSNIIYFGEEGAPFSHSVDIYILFFGSSWSALCAKFQLKKAKNSLWRFLFSLSTPHIHTHNSIYCLLFLLQTIPWSMYFF